MSRLGRFAVVGILVAGGFAGAGQQAVAAIHVPFGDVFCHAESTGPHYFYSRIEQSSYDWQESLAAWWPRDAAERRGLDGQTLQYLAAGFSRYVTENYPVDYLLSPRCELAEDGSGPAEIERAVYMARDGMLLPYEGNQKTAVDWVPNFGGVFRHNARALLDRVALVIGNGDYHQLLSLRGLVNDAEDVGAALERLRFDTTVLVDADATSMNHALREFAPRAGRADIALVFYVGHGVEVGGINYLLPVSASLEAAADLSVQAVALDTVVTAVSGSRVPIVILDADRIDPFDGGADEEQNASGGGAASSVDAGDSENGVLVAYATTAGSLAYTTRGLEGPENGVYTEALLAQLEEAGLDLEVMFRRVGASVVASSHGLQRPVVYSTLTESRPIRLAGLEPPPAPGRPPLAR